jgi:hypothetical protein
MVSYTQAPKSAQPANPLTHTALARPLTSPRTRPGNWHPTPSTHPSPTRIHLHAPLSPSVSGSRRRRFARCDGDSRDEAAGTATRLSSGGRGGLSSGARARHPPFASTYTLPTASSWWEVWCGAAEVVVVHVEEGSDEEEGASPMPCCTHWWGPHTRTVFPWGKPWIH